MKQDETSTDLGSISIWVRITKQKIIIYENKKDRR